MSKDNLNYEELLQIIEWVETASRFAEFHLKVGDIEIDLTKRVGTGPAPTLQVAAAGAPQGGELSNGVVIPQQAPFPKRQSLPQYPAGTVLVKSPMVGTFYRAPEPGTKPYVEVGSRVTPETIVCIIEVMKLMNSVPAGAAGVVTHILIEDAAPVESGQVLMVIDPKA